MDLAREYIRRVQPDAEIVEVSCTTGAGLDIWLRWFDGKAG
jgi:Ni2+-binding GTPase involved in maturation of urease and hydrogenase